jgi:enoyl-CoA hydratase
MKAYTTIQTAVLDGMIGRITFSRPQVLNALNTATISETLDAVRDMQNNPAVRVLVFTGEGRSFVAGADIQEMLGKTADEARTYAEFGQGLFNAIQDMDRPVIAAVNGFALGGGLEVALSCDIRIASDRATFGLPEITLGVIPGWGGMQRASRLIGPALAKELIFTGEHINAERALAIGLVNRVVPHETLQAEAIAMAQKISRQGPLAVMQAKRVISSGFEMPLREALKIDIETFSDLFNTEDQKEGMQAFVQKRPPQFKGR